MATVTAATDLRGMHRIRWPKDGEPEMQCARCFEFAPITNEFWSPVHGTQRCRTCLIEFANRRTRAAMRRKRAGNRDIARAYEADFWRRKYSKLARISRGMAA